MTQLPPAVRRPDDERAVPAARTPLFGRQAEVAALMKLITHGPSLVTITGTGGIGKTRLAVEVVRQTGHQPVFVQLADADRTDVTVTLAQAVDRAVDAARTQAQHAADRFGPGEGSAVLVLDTFDRLLGTDHPLEAARIIWQAWQHAPDLVMIVTSRTRLTLRDERVVPLTGLGLEPDGPAVEMFRERSLAVGGDLSDPRQDEAIVAICRLLRGVPLAIELAAARTIQLPPLALLAQLRSPGSGHLLGVLASGALDAPARQRSMRATMAWSYHLLPGPQQALFRRLGVFVGSFSLEAAERVCPGPKPDGSGLPSAAVLDGIGALVDLQLLEPAGGDPEFPRFALMDLPRAYAVELLEMSGEAEAARDRLLTWCLDFAKRAGRGLTSTQERRWLDLVEADLPTVRTALAAFAERVDSISGLTLITELAAFWMHRGPIREALTWLRTFLDIDRSRGAPDSLLRDVGLGWVQRLRLESGDSSDLGELRTIRAAVTARRCSPGQWYHCTDHLVVALIRDAGLAEGATLIDSGIARALAADDSHWLSVFLFRRAQLRWTGARGGAAGVDGAIPYVEEALAVAHSSGHRLIAAWAENLLGLCHVAARDWASARIAMTAALVAFRDIGDHAAAATTLQHLAAMLTELGRTADAARCLRDAIVATRRVGDASGEMQCTWGIAFVAVRSGLLLEATRMDDALLDYLGAIERDLPAELVDDYDAAMTQARASLGIGPRASRGHGWGWLRTRALELADDLGKRVDPEIGIGGIAAFGAAVGTTAGAQPGAQVGARIGTQIGAQSGAQFGAKFGTEAAAFVADGLEFGAAIRVDGGAVGSGNGLPGPTHPALTVSTTSMPAIGVVVSQLVDVATEAQQGAEHGHGAGTTTARASDRGSRGRGSTVRAELTGRELEILAAIASGQTNAQIAKDLFLSAKTVMHHSTSIYRKLGVRGRAEAVALAYRTGVLLAPHQ